LGDYKREVNIKIVYVNDSFNCYCYTLTETVLYGWKKNTT